MKRLTLLLGAFLLTAASFAQPAMPPTARIANGPYVLNVTEDGFTVVWNSKADAMGWVEVAPMDGSHFYSTDRPKYYNSHLGRHVVGRMHQVRVSGLQPGTTYRYRIMQRGIFVDEGNKRTILDDGDGSEVYRQKPYTIKTLDPAQQRVDFWVVNDIHSRDSVFQLLIKDAPKAQPDFVCLNGDLSSQTENEQMLWDACLSSASKILTPAGIPLVVTHGNHEHRGSYAGHWLDYFPTPTGETYYTFRRGPAFFIVLDGCEDKPDNDLRYYGLGDWDAYRQQQAEWLKGVVASDEFRAAPVRIVLIHMIPGKEDSWYGEQQIRKLFVPELVGKGIDLMLCGHYHRYFWIDDDSRGVDFPILVNSNNDCLRVSAGPKGIDLKVVDTAGAVIKQHHIDKKTR